MVRAEIDLAMAEKLERYLEAELKRVKALTDPVRRLHAAHGNVGVLQRYFLTMGDVRQDTLAELKDQGWSWGELADQLGLDRRYVAKLTRWQRSDWKR